jgi:hypothetical protein
VSQPPFRLAPYCASIVSMADQETLLPRRRRGPKPTGKGQQVVVRCQPDLLAAVDAYRSTFSPIMNRPAVLRRIAAEFLCRRGFLAK